MFHNVVDTEEQVYSQFAITKKSFERFIEHLVSQRNKAMDAELLQQAIDRPCNYANHYCITFDDIYDTVYTNAYPVLKKYNIPFVAFVTDGLVGTVDPWSKMPMITETHLREMLKDPLCILASHGTEHKMFRDYTHTEAVTALVDSKRILAEKYGRNITLFAFPFGRRVEVSNDAIRCVKEAGYTCGFSALDGSLKQRWLSGRFFLPRVLVGEEYVQLETKS
jgi:peptidoglycan/xylan/chitin deacetylase (PgdA/CDA1 family)